MWHVYMFYIKNQIQKTLGMLGLQNTMTLKNAFLCINLDYQAVAPFRYIIG